MPRALWSSPQHTLSGCLPAAGHHRLESLLYEEIWVAVIALVILGVAGPLSPLFLLVLFVAGRFVGGAMVVVVVVM